MDLSELIRLWGEPLNKPATTQQNATAGTGEAQQPILDELRAMRDLYQAGLEENRALRQEVRELREVMLRLPAPQSIERNPERPATPQERREQDAPVDDDPHGLRRLARALRDDSE